MRRDSPGRPNGGYVYRSLVEAREAGLALAAYLARRFPHASRELWAQRARRGELRVGGRAAQPTLRLAPGMVVEWARPPWMEPAAPRAFALLYEDADLLAVAKPAGLPTLPGAGFLEHTLWSLVRRHFPEATPVHRLGRWTSGVVLFARTDAARRETARAFRNRVVVKQYRALAAGRPRRVRFEVATPIGPVPYAPLGSVHAATPLGRPSASEVVVLRRGADRFLAQVRIRTGRPHQVRIHLAAAGHPLVGDPLYRPGGLPAAAGRALPGDPGYRLHAAEVSLPLGGLPALRVTCAPPPDLR